MCNSENNVYRFLSQLGIAKGEHIIVHASWRAIKKVFPQISPDQFVNTLKSMLTNEGSLIFPSFTYCFKKNDGTNEKYDREKSISKVGYLSEIFRNSEGVVRSTSPTHSFSIWGEASRDMNNLISPKSPLGDKSILGWLAKRKNSSILMFGVHFESFTFGHYLETKSNIPWKNYSPWEYLGVQNIGVAVNYEEELYEIPGCAKSFISFEKYLIEKNIIYYQGVNDADLCFIKIDDILEEGIRYFSNYYEKLLCKEGQCPACDSRRKIFLSKK